MLNQEELSVKCVKEEREAHVPVLVHGLLLLLSTEAAATLKQQLQLNNISATSPSLDFFAAPQL